MAVLVKYFLISLSIFIVGCASSIDFIEGAPCETSDNCVYEYCGSPRGCIDYVCAKYNHADTYYYCQKKSDITDKEMIVSEIQESNDNGQTNNVDENTK